MEFTDQRNYFQNLLPFTVVAKMEPVCFIPSCAVFEKNSDYVLHFCPFHFLGKKTMSKEFLYTVKFQNIFLCIKNPSPEIIIFIFTIQKIL